MRIETIEQWNERWADTTQFFFIILGEGGRQAEISRAAENQASRESARNALWVPDTSIIPSRTPDLTGGQSGTVACTVCMSRHVVATYREADLPTRVLDNRIDNAFGDAGTHDDTSS